MPVMSFKVDPQSAKRIRRNARAAKSSLSEYLRQAALGGNDKKPAENLWRKHPVSGLPYNAADIGRIVTDAEVREALADFP